MSLAERRVLPRNKLHLALRLGAIDIDAGLLQPSDVMFASRFDDVKSLLTMRQTFGDERSEHAMPLLVRGKKCTDMSKAIDHGAREMNLALGQRPERRCKRLLRVRLEEDPFCPRAPDLINQFVRLMRGQNEDLSLRSIFHDPARGFQTVQVRHGHIEKDDIGPELPGLLDSFSSIRC